MERRQYCGKFIVWAGLGSMKNSICCAERVSSYAFRRKIKNNENIGIDFRGFARSLQARSERNRGSMMIDIIFVGESVSSGIRLFTVPSASACTEGSWRKSLTRSGL